MDIGEIERMTIDDCVKGIPGGTPPFPLGAIAEQGWNVLREDMPLPLAALKRREIDNNRSWMLEFMKRSGVVFCPHGKAFLAPQLVGEMLDAGAWGVAVANVAHLQVYRRFGVSRVIFANQLVGSQTLRYVLDALAGDPEFEFYGLVDSLEGVAALAAAARARDAGRPVQLLIEGGAPGGRNGCRTLDSALAVARAIKAEEPFLTLRGVEGYEGILPGANGTEVEERIDRFLDFMIDIARACVGGDLLGTGPVIMSAGGSQYCDIVATRLTGADVGREILPIVRAGSFLAHDSGLYFEAFKRMLERSEAARKIGGGMRPAAEIWSYVQSRPEPDRVILTMGKRDCSYSLGLPVPATWFRPGEHNAPRALDGGHTVTRLDDQHAYMAVPPDSALRFGDMVCCGVSHPTTFVNKWRLLYVVDDNYDVVQAVATFF